MPDKAASVASNVPQWRLGKGQTATTDLEALKVKQRPHEQESNSHSSVVSITSIRELLAPGANQRTTPIPAAHRFPP